MGRTFTLLAAVAIVVAASESVTAAEGAGTRINLRSLEASRSIDPRGLTQYRPTRRRAPTGTLYPFPFTPPDYRELSRGLHARGSIDLGITSNGNDTRRAYWDDYLDRSPGFLLNDFYVDLRDSHIGAYLHADGGAVERDDQHYAGEAGIAGWLRVRGEYDEVPHRLMNDATSFYDGIGTGNLELPVDLIPAANTDAEIDAALMDLTFQALGVNRERGRIEFEAKPLQILRVFADYRVEERKGEKPSSGSLAFAFAFPGFGSVVETIEPVDYKTHDLTTGLQLLHPWLQLNLSYAFSYFDNPYEALRWENPFMAGGSDVGQLALDPDNRWHNVKGDLGFILPFSGRFTTSWSYSRAEQDEVLLAPTVNVAAPDWLDPLTALDKPSARAEFRTLLSHSRLQFRPIRQLQLKAELRYFDRDSDLNYESFNPALNFYGYIPEDAYFGAFFTVPRYKSVPYGYDKWNVKGGGVVRPGWRTTVEFEFEHETYRRDHRVRRKTKEDRYRFSLTNRGLPFATVLVSYEFAYKKGDDVDTTRDFKFYTAGPDFFALPAPFFSGTPLRTLAEFQQFDLAGRDQQIFNGRMNAAIGDVGDVAASVRFIDNDYDVIYGLDYDRSADGNLEFTYQPSPKLNASAHVSVEARQHEMRSINAVGFRAPFNFITPTTIDNFDPLDFAADFPVFPPAFPPFFFPTDAVFPLDNEWRMRVETYTWRLGFDIEMQLWNRLTLDLHGLYQHSNEQRDYSFASDGALAAGLTGDDVGTDFPDLQNTDRIFESSLLYEANDAWATRFFFRYQYSTFDNYQLRGLQPRIGHILSLSHRDKDFTAAIFGATVRFRF